jgi:lysophospholipase
MENKNKINPSSAEQKDVFSPFGYFTSHDNLSIRYGIWPFCPGDKSHEKKGSVILLNGRKDFMENYAETVKDLNQRGFDVYGFDWRGQGLSSRLLKNRHKGFVNSYKDYIKDLALFYGKIVKPAAKPPLIILSHSMGGHISLRFLHDHAQGIDAAVLVSPMIDIFFRSRFHKWFAGVLVRMAIKAGLDDHYVLSSRGDRFSTKKKFEGNKVTSDPERFMVEKRAVAENPDLALGDPTYRWIAATFESTRILARSGYAERIKTPVLMVGGELDRVVSIKAQKAISDKLQNGKFVLIKGARHEILNEMDSIRNVFWDAFDRFVESLFKK